MIIEYGVTKTRKGCTAWEKTPRKTIKAKFRDTCMCNGLTKAKMWIHERRAEWLNERDIRSIDIEIVIPDELVTHNETIAITLSCDLLEQARQKAMTHGVGLSVFIEQLILDSFAN